MVNPNRFYTYAYLREDGTPYYIGKGQRGRAYRKDGKPCVVPKDKSRIIFLKQNLTEEEAFKHEIYMIAVFGRKDLGTGILRNKTDGGEGSSGAIISEETKRKRRGKKWWNDGKGNHKKSIECPGPNWVLGVSEETKRKLSELNRGKNNPNYGKKGEDNACYGKKWWNDGKGNHKKSIECPGEGWVLGYDNKKSKELGLGIHSITTEERQEIGRRVCKQKWMCLETGFITNAGNLTKYQKARGIDTSKRKRIA